MCFIRDECKEDDEDEIRRNPRATTFRLTVCLLQVVTLKLKSESISINLLMNFYSGPRT